MVQSRCFVRDSTDSGVGTWVLGVGAPDPHCCGPLRKREDSAECCLCFKASVAYWHNAPPRWHGVHSPSFLSMPALETLSFLVRRRVLFGHLAPLVLRWDSHSVQVDVKPVIDLEVTIALLPYLFDKLLQRYIISLHWPESGKHPTRSFGAFTVALQSVEDISECDASRGPPFTQMCFSQLRSGHCESASEPSVRCGC